MKLRNLLVITNNYPNSDNSYASEIFVKEQVKYLKENFHTIYIISPVAYGVEYLRKTTHENYQYDNVKVFFPKYFNIPFFYKYLKSIWIKLELRSILKLIEKQGINFDLIHAHFTWPSGSVAAELKTIYNVPVIITEHTSNTFINMISNKDKHSIKAWNKADAIIRVNRRDISLFEEVGIPLKKVYYIPNGLDENKFKVLDRQKCKDKLNLPNDKKIILNVGHLYSPLKGHTYLVKAMNEIVNKMCDIHCYIVGDGVLKNELQTQIVKYDLQEYVTLVGSISHDEISLWMNACDIFVLPSLKESFGIVQIEAMACGKPVVATYNGGSEEIIKSENHGLLCEPANVIDLQKVILQALSKDWDSRTIIKYSSKYNMSNISKEILDIYSRVLDKS
nr:glycosyltransferase family 4 protein [uncultured Methanolobus sp.]